MPKIMSIGQKTNIFMRFQNWYPISLDVEVQPGCIVRNPDLMNSNIHKLVVIGPIFSNSFATVKGDQYMNCQSVLGVADQLNGLEHISRISLTLLRAGGGGTLGPDNF